MNRWFTAGFILLFLCFGAQELEAQRSRTTRTRTTSNNERSRTRDENKEPMARPWMAIHLGNVGFGNGFSLSGKYSYGYEFEKRFSLGANAKFYYDFINGFGSQPDLNLFSYGAAAFARVKITNDIYAHGEYGITSFDRSFQGPRENILFPAAGLGYKSGIDDWTFGIHLLFPFNQRVRSLINIEYWIDFNYKF